MRRAFLPSFPIHFGQPPLTNQSMNTSSVVLVPFSDLDSVWPSCCPWPHRARFWILLLLFESWSERRIYKHEPQPLQLEHHADHTLQFSHVPLPGWTPAAVVAQVLTGCQSSARIMWDCFVSLIDWKKERSTITALVSAEVRGWPVTLDYFCLSRALMQTDSLR